MNCNTTHYRANSSSVPGDPTAEARTWIGTPWVHQHRAKGIAVDCAGLVIGVARALGIVAPDFDVNGYPRRPDGTLIERCREFMIEVPRAELQPGMVLALATERDPQHLGIVGDYLHGGMSLIHAADRVSHGRVVETRLVFANRQRFRGAFALPGVAYV